MYKKKRTKGEKIYLGILEVIAVVFLITSFPISNDSFVGIFSFVMISVVVIGLW
jgi:hypothetical protein